MNIKLATGAALLIAAVSLGACQDDYASDQRSNAGAGQVRHIKVAYSQEKPLFALSTFSYAFSQEASDKTFEICAQNSQMYVVQLDNGVPWAEALSGAPWTEKERQRWDNFKRKHPPNQPFYLSLAPLDFDRKDLAGPLEGTKMPSNVKGAAFDSDAVMTAYLNYARRAVEFFQPDFLNLGVEAGELAHRRPEAWPAFSRLIVHVMTELKRDDPNLKIGISFGLQTLMDSATAARSRDLIEKSDYLGLSFYPYMSGFHEKFGASPLPAPPNEWRKPLEWVRGYTNKPIAICETGYNSARTSARSFGVRLNGSPALQKQYVEELGAIAARDNHLFVIYYFPIDIDKMLAALPDKGASGAVLWRENGLLDSSLKAKPALESWKNILAGNATPADPSSPTPQPVTAVPVATLDFAATGDLFQSGPGGGVTLEKRAAPGGEGAMKWTYKASKAEWKWALRTVALGTLTGATSLEFDVRSKQAGPFVLQIKEAGGESFYRTIQTGREWTRITIDLQSLEVDKSTRQNGVLELENVNQVVLAAGGDQKDGSYAMLFSAMTFSK